MSTMSGNSNESENVIDEKLAAMMAQVELEAEEIKEDDDAVKSDLHNKSLRMLTPEQVDKEKKEKEREQLTPAKRHALLRKMIRDKRADRTRMAPGQQQTDARGRRVPNQQRMTQQQLNKIRNGQMGGVGGAAGIDPNNITPDAMAQATEMLRKNPHLMPS